MKSFLALVILGSILLSAIDARLIIRARRQTEREGEASKTESPASEVVVIKDTNRNFPSFFPRLFPRLFTPPSGPNSSNDGNIFDIDINEQDGTFNFGGQLPSLHHFHDFHRSFAEIFDAIQKRFEEIANSMMNTHGLGPSFRPTVDLDSIPNGTNNTVSEVVEFGGRKYLKKTTTIKKGGPGSALFIQSTTFESLDESENEANPPPSNPEQPIQPEESKVDQASSTSTSTIQSSTKDEREREEITPSSA